MQLRSGDLVLRSFEPALTGVLYDVRNHPSVRQYLRSTGAIAREDHERWVRQNLVNARTAHVFVAFAGETPVGLALLRNFQAEAAEIGVMMVDARRRRLAAYKAAHLIA